MTLNEVKPGYGGVIAAVGGEGALRRRLLDMGLTPHTRVDVRKVAPMGDPIELVLRGYVLTIRGEDAAKIELEGAAPDVCTSPYCDICETGENNESTAGGRREHRRGRRARAGRV